MLTVRAKLQLQITASAYFALAATLRGNAPVEMPVDADYAAMEGLARDAIRECIALGWTEPHYFLPAQSSVRLLLKLLFPTTQSIYLNYADDEMSTLVREELGLLSPTLH